APLLVRGARHDELVDRLELPTVLDEFASEVVEQFGMRGRFALRAEVVRRADEALAEVVLPESVHDHTREQVPRTALAVRHPVRERDARRFRGALGVRGVAEPLVLVGAGEYLRESRRGDAVLAVGLAADEVM